MNYEEAIRLLREMEKLGVGVRVTFEITVDERCSTVSYETLETFSDRLRRFRKEKRIRQKELAELIGVSVTSIQAYERGEYKPSFERMIKLSDALGCTIDELCGTKAEGEVK